MKKLATFFLLFATIVLATVSCTKEIFFNKGERVHFSAGSASDATKTVYGTVDEGNKTQAINWVVGDKIKIAGKNCPVNEAEGTTDVAGYKVASINPDSKGDNYSKIELDDAGLGLVWGEPGTIHNFYAVYPGATGTVTTEGKITGSIPAAQSFGTITGTTEKVVPPDMTNLYMVAATTGVEAGTKIKQGDEEIFLDFKPVSTVLEFTITNKFEDHKCAMNVSSISLISEGHALSGGFEVDMTQEGRNGRKKTALATGLVVADNSTVTINFSEPVAVAYEKTLNFHFFLNPGNATEVDDLTFEIKGVNAGTSEPFTRRAKLAKASGEGVAFPTHKNTRITGIMIPEGIAWEIEGVLSIVPWTSVSEEDVILE